MGCTMARTPSNMLALGTKAPNFTLPGTVSGENVSLANIKSNCATVIMFISNHCPFVKILKNQLSAVSHEYQAKGVQFVAICSNDVKNFPDDAPELMKKDAHDYGYPFPYLYDESQEVAKAYDAACTPDLYVFDSELKLVYRGQFDNARPNNGVTPSGEDLTNALDAILEGRPVSTDQHPSLGCNIKWKTSEPA